MQCINEQEGTIWQFVYCRGDRLIEVKFTVNKGAAFWELESVPLIEGDRFNRGPRNRVLTVLSRVFTKKKEKDKSLLNLPKASQMVLRILFGFWIE